MTSDVSAARITVAESKLRLRSKLLDENVVEEQVVDRMEIMFDLMRLAPRLTRDFETIHRRRGWTYAGFRIVNQLWVLGDLEPSDLARLTGSSRASISSALRTLESGGYVARSTKTSDRRLVRVALTAKGRRSLKSAIADQAQRERAWLEILSAAERATLEHLLTKLAEQAHPVEG